MALNYVSSHLTQDIEDVAVRDGAIFVLHHAGVVSSVRRNNALHHQAPVLVSQLSKDT